MNSKPVPRSALITMVAVAMVLTIALLVILATAVIIGKMGDSGGRIVLEIIALAVGLGWLIDLICLVLSLGVNSLFDGDSKP